MPSGLLAQVAPTPLELATHAVEHERAAQKPAELAALIEWCAERPAPRTALEIGSYHGGTLWLWRQLWPAALLIAVDDFSLAPCQECAHRRAHSDCPYRRIEDALGRWPRGRLLRADSHAASSRDAVAAWARGGVDFLHIDGDHSDAGVRRDVVLYWPLVRSGGVMVLHDAAGEGWPDVVAYWRELAAEHGARAFLIHEPADDWGGLGVVVKP